MEPVSAVLKLREEYPRWGKDKLVIMLQEKAYQVSASTVGQILRRLRERGVLRKQIPNHISARKRQRQRPYATKKLGNYQIKEVGDIVELDILDLRPLPGVLLKHFSAHDMDLKQKLRRMGQCLCRRRGS